MRLLIYRQNITGVKRAVCMMASGCPVPFQSSWVIIVSHSTCVLDDEEYMEAAPRASSALRRAGKTKLVKAYNYFVMKLDTLIRLRLSAWTNCHKSVIICMFKSAMAHHGWAGHPRVHCDTQK